MLAENVKYYFGTNIEDLFCTNIYVQYHAEICTENVCANVPTFQNLICVLIKIEFGFALLVKY